MIIQLNAPFRYCSVPFSPTFDAGAYEQAADKARKAALEAQKAALEAATEKVGVDMFVPIASSVV